MSTAALAWRYLWSRPLQAALNLLLLALGLGSITFVLLAGHQVERAFQRDLAGIDAVVGAKGSPMQLILSGVFHLDVPTGNVPLAEVEALARQPQVAQVIPLSLGDSYGGFRIAGTTPAWLAHYQVAFVQGRPWQQPMEAVLGHQVARAGGLKPGDAFAGSHGLAGGDTHASRPYAVAGVLAPCGCVADRLVLTSLESVWAVHETHAPAPPASKPAGTAKAGPHAHAHAPGKAEAEEDHAHEAPREVTAALVRYRTPLAAVSFPRFVNSSTRLQAAAPALEVSRLLRMLGVGGEVLRGVGAVLLVAAALSVFLALWSAVRERQADLALLRMLGAPPRRVAGLLLAESLWLALLATVLGLAVGHGLMAGVAQLLAERGSLPVSASAWLVQEAWVAVLAFGVALVAAAIPVASAYRADAGRLLEAA